MTTQIDAAVSAGSTVRVTGVWAGLTGQHHVIGELAEAAAGHGMGQSWLITGPAGSGRSIVALAFAAALQCETHTGCGHCPGCEAVLARVHADLVIVSPEGLSIGIDDAKELVRKASTRPTVGHWRVMIIEDADRFTDEAENTFLKTLEEPPERTVILLCAPSPADMLLTTASRCRKVQPADSLERRPDPRPRRRRRRPCHRRVRRPGGAGSSWTRPAPRHR